MHTSLKLFTLLGAMLILLSGSAIAQKKPNILVIWGDDIGAYNISAYNLGMMGYKTPNIDQLAKEGALFTDCYGQQSCTAGRSAFALGQVPFRTGLLTIGMPGSEHGIPDWTPTIGDIMKEHGYTTGQFGKNHLGDRDKHLPTEHGFDEFFGNLYHLNAEEEPETYYYPKDPEFKKKFAPRGVIHSTADGKVEDTGPLTRKRMETVDDEFRNGAKDFISGAVNNEKPFFVWLNTTRMHVWTHLKKEYQGKSGISLYADGMLELDDMIGNMIAHLKELGVYDNTIIVFSSDNGAEKFTWPDGGTVPWYGEKGSTWEGGFRVPLIVKWPGALEPGTIINDIIAHEDWIPTLAAAAGDPNVVEKLKNGAEYNNKTWKVHLDGYNFLPFFKGETKKSPREEMYYFSAGGELNAIRVNDFKISFATILGGSMPMGYRHTQAWPVVSNLRADPFETMHTESDMYIRWYGDNMWTFIPAAAFVKKFLSSLKGYPMQAGSSLNMAGVNYTTLRTLGILEQLEELDVKSTW